MSDEIKAPEEKKTKQSKTDREEISEFNKEVLGRLDSPLIVHKKSDASYEENTSAFEMNETHTEEERPTLVRHRFKKEKKSKKGYVALLFVIVFAAGIFAGLYYTGNITFGEKETTTVSTTQAVTEPVTSVEDNYIGKIVIKDIYIFVDGKEVNGIEGLQDALQYVDPSTTAYEIIDEHANSDFLNGDVLLILQSMGFFGEDTQITHIEKTGLVAYAETTTLPPETTKKSKKKKKKSSEQTAQAEEDEDNQG